MTKRHGKLADPIEVLSPARIRDLLDYDPNTGVLTWRERPVRPGPDISRDKGWNNRFAGKTAGCVTGLGYIMIRIRPSLGCLCNVLAHRLAWAHYYGVWPDGHLDHRNRIRTDNRIVNLRQATVSQNMTNKALRRDNTSGVKGVSFQAARGKWRARLNIDGRQVFYGYFETKEEAIRARNKAASRLLGDFACEGHD